MHFKLHVKSSFSALILRLELISSVMNNVGLLQIDGLRVQKNITDSWYWPDYCVKYNAQNICSP